MVPLVQKMMAASSGSYSESRMIVIDRERKTNLADWRSLDRRDRHPGREI